jgi:hypothetical protein
MTTLLALMILTAIPPNKEPPLIVQKKIDIEGIYLVTGVESGHKYNGASVIRQLDVSDSYYVVNVVNRVIVTGIGLRTGDSLSVSWSDGTKSHGISVYRITSGTLSGRWSTVGQIHRETLKFVSELPEE